MCLSSDRNRTREDYHSNEFAIKSFTEFEVSAGGIYPESANNPL